MTEGDGVREEGLGKGLLKWTIKQNQERVKSGFEGKGGKVN